MHPGTPSPTRLLADWVVSSRWPAVHAGARAAAARSLLNWLGCALGGANDPTVDRLVAALEPLAGRGTSPLLGRSEASDPGTAALVHAFASNILDYDDTHWATAIHPAGTVASALFAWAGQARVSGEALLHAFLLGMEAECRIGLAVSPGHYERGWHITATCGGFGAAVAVGRVMGLSQQQMAWAIGHAATQSSGLVASLGTMAKSLNIGHAARNGLVAAQLARHGMTAHEQALEAKFGFAEVMGPGRLAATLCDRLGEHWECERNTFKPYPCGFLLHPAIVACLALPAAGALAVDDINQLVVDVHPLAQVRADRRHPANGMESKLSLQHAVAMALLRGDAGVRAFTDAAVHDPAIRACRDKVRLVSDEKLSAQDARIELHLRAGTSVSHEVRCPPGQDPVNMSDTGLERKFRELVAYGAPHCDADRMLEALAGLAQAGDAAGLLRLAVRTT
jgi:2-methylcitrate dehydratase PrpD